MIKMNTQHPLFPVKMVASWRSPSSEKVNEYLLDWLLDPSSLTARLKKHCQQFRVQVLGQKIEACSDLESNDDIKVAEPVLVREVLLFCDEVPQVFARSLLPLSSLTGDEKKLAELGNQSLGQVLFNSPQLQRKCIEISSFNRDNSVAKLASHYQLPNQEKLWGRRSVFMLQGKPLMVGEVFLPGAHAYSKETVI